MSLTKFPSSLSKDTLKVNTIDDLRNITDPKENSTAQVLGYYTPGGGNAGSFRIWKEGDPPGTYVDNGWDIIVPTGGDGSSAWVMVPLSTNSISVHGNDVTPGDNIVFVRQKVTSPTDEAVTVQIQRQADSATAANPKALRALTTIASGVDSVEYAISGELTNNSDAVNGGAAALSGVSLKNAKGNTFAGHFQVKDTTGDISSVGGSMVGQELNIQANGADDANVRIGYDVIARTYQPNFATAGAGEFHAGIRIRNSSLGAEGGKWENALIIQDGVQTIPNAITIENSPGTSVGYGIEDEGLKARGLDLRGQYGVAAIDCRNANLTTNDILLRLKDRGKIEFETGVTMKWEGSLGIPSMDLAGQPTQQTVGAAGTASALPSNPLGYLKIHLNGVDVVLPYYRQQ